MTAFPSRHQGSARSTILHRGGGGGVCEGASAGRKIPRGRAADTPCKRIAIWLNYQSLVANTEIQVQ